MNPIFRHLGSDRWNLRHPVPVRMGILPFQRLPAAGAQTSLQILRLVHLVGRQPVLFRPRVGVQATRHAGDQSAPWSVSQWQGRRLTGGFDKLRQFGRNLSSRIATRRRRNPLLG
ncbi:MAG: hypothetical protein HQL73_03695 [Magnetococcales bacterium]|nr:hypothetical protein [Magnetococcales bacterium]